jgi:alanine dehydrogenase
MRIGIPKEIKPLEGRVALVPEACGDLTRQGHEVLVELSAGTASGFSDEAYAGAGARLVEGAEALYAGAELVVKVKEPWGPEIDLLRPDHLLFSFLHLAANRQLMERLREIGLTALAYETVEQGGRLPILVPMSDIAGRLAVQIGTNLLYSPNGGKGLLLGGMPAAERGQVVVLGAGTAGSAAVRMAASIGACVTVFDRNPEKLAAMRRTGPNVTTLYPYADSISRAVFEADLFVGAVLIPGAKAPRLISEAQVASMEPGSVIVDISVDQGGCVETTHPTTYEAPTYKAHEVTHFAVTNMPGAVPCTASRALCASLSPWVARLASPRWRDDPSLAAAVNVAAGEVVHPALTVP